MGLSVWGELGVGLRAHGQPPSQHYHHLHSSLLLLARNPSPKPYTSYNLGCARSECLPSVRVCLSRVQRASHSVARPYVCNLSNLNIMSAFRPPPPPSQKVESGSRYRKAQNLTSFVAISPCSMVLRVRNLLSSNVGRHCPRVLSETLRELGSCKTS